MRTFLGHGDAGTAMCSATRQCGTVQPGHLAG